MDAFANRLGCRLNIFSFKCLGIPFGAYFKFAPIWDWKKQDSKLDWSCGEINLCRKDKGLHC